MRWTGRGGSGNIEDRRGFGGKLALGGGLGTIALVVISLLLGQNPLQYINLQDQSGPEQAVQSSPEEDAKAKFVAVVLKDTEDVWDTIFESQLHLAYQKPKLVLFSGSDESGCGYANAATGPFYCPSDEKVYIDLSFYDELQSRFRAPGDFAMAYVIAHE